MILLSNRVLSDRVDGRAADEIEGKAVTYNVWGHQEIAPFRNPGALAGRKSRLTSPVTSVTPSRFFLHIFRQGSTSPTSRLSPGRMLASIYDRWGARLLEQNVRVFLQARGNVNKGIRNTLEKDPSMFFAYNNGITATAESVLTE